MHVVEKVIWKECCSYLFSRPANAAFVRGQVIIRKCSYQAPVPLVKEKYMMAAQLDFTKSWAPYELLTQIREILKDEVPLLKREFLEVSGEKSQKTLSSEPGGVTIMQWNMLAQSLSTGNDNFVRCPSEALEWDRRKLCIMEEILRINPDIVCLQEVDHYGFLSTALKSVGYSGCFMPKPDSPALYAPKSNGPDGCAIFYNDELLELVDQQCNVLKSNKVDTNQVCIMSKFQLKDGAGAVFSVATTHLKAKNGWDELRHSQGLNLLERLKNFAEDGPLVVCGDFNAPPTEPVIDAFKESDLELTSSYELKSDFPQYTTWKIRGGEKENDVCRIIDYMWFTHKKMNIDSLLSIPTDEEIGPDRLPSLCYPSDHFSLAAKYIL